MSEELTVLCDMDQVLAEFRGSLVQQMEDEGLLQPGEITLEEIVTDKASDSLPSGLKGDIDRIVTTPGFFAELELVEGAEDGLRGLHEGLQELGMPLKICSKPYKPIRDQCIIEKKHFLDEHWGDLRLSTTAVFPQDKTIIDGLMIIDDSSGVANGARIPTWKHVVFDAPHNRRINTGYRVHGWDELDSMLEIAEDLAS